MGESRMGPPTALVLELAGIYAISEFIESGTYLGTRLLGEPALRSCNHD